MTSFYLKSSAAMKLFEPEQGLQELRQWLMSNDNLLLLTSELTMLEVPVNLSKNRLIEARGFFENLTLIRVREAFLTMLFSQCSLASRL